MLALLFRHPLLDDSDVTYEITSPKTASEPSANSAPSIAPIADLPMVSEAGEQVAVVPLELNYFDSNNDPVDDIGVEILDSLGQLHTGTLQGGLLTMPDLPIGQCQISYLGTTDVDEQQLIEKRKVFKQYLSDMLAEIKAQAAREDALFEQQDLIDQWLIQLGATMTGVYDGGKSVVQGIADIVTFTVDVQLQVYSACYDLIDSLMRGDIPAIKQQMETILAHTEKSHQSLTEAFELLVVIVEDDETRTALANFPNDYFNAHSFVEKHRIGGIFLFEILLAVLTAGYGAAASAASKSKYVVKAHKALTEIADIIKRKRLNRQQTHALAPSNTKTVEKIEQPPKKLAQPKFKRLPPPVSIAEALNRLTLARQSIIKHGYRAKYSDDELLAMAQAGKVANERFHVRFMDANYLEYKGKPGNLGQPFEGESGYGAKYWSTTFDQIEDADSDPKIISEKLGLDYQPDKQFVMVVIDTEKTKNIADTHSIIPTYQNLGKFAKEELPSNFSVEEVDKLMTPEFQSHYAQQYQAALDSGLMKDEWHTAGAVKYFSEHSADKTEFDLMQKRLLMQDKLGNNQHFLGNGLTKTLLPNDGQFGAVETFNFERKLVNLEEFGDAIKISDILTPIGK
ncbi:hypothetical protein DXX93_08545 [Thalassotalea euphylliae]|uniref:Uncharacterized protein n=2 Tax=Thalassotalea euphylliae TaxID=1655234 RepID=A0A3E0TQ04_9GAMM|nr:hypothetical protein DXX93_08545 [Thalassotalea euphylliae]